MSWNKYYIVVTGAATSDHPQLLARLGLTGYRPAGAASFFATNKSNDLFIGNYGGHLVIAEPELTGAFFEKTPSETARRFAEAFPDSEIAALAENSTVGQFGYALLERGQRRRLKHGCDGEIYEDSGAPLPEEAALLAGEIFPEEEMEEMREAEGEEAAAAMVLFEAGWRTPNELSRRYFGTSIEELDENALPMTRYVRG